MALAGSVEVSYHVRDIREWQRVDIISGIAAYQLKCFVLVKELGVYRSVSVFLGVFYIH